MNYAVKVSDLTKRYGNKQALSEVGFAVSEGSCFGLLGPNGAGKSTIMKIITGIIDFDSGQVEVFGSNMARQKDAVRRGVGYVPQEITLYDKLSGYDNLVFFGEAYGVPKSELNQRIQEVLEQVGLSDRQKDAVSTYSGGMKRRINIAAALLHRPKLVFLDEPTVGIDPQSRNHIFEMIRSLQSQGITVIYSTHYMEEVEALCDDIAIIDHGKVVVQGRLAELIGEYASHAIYVETENGTEMPDLPGLTGKKSKGPGWVLEVEPVLPAMQQLAAYYNDHQVPVKSLEIMRPSLEQVFLTLTGTRLRDE